MFRLLSSFIALQKDEEKAKYANETIPSWLANFEKILAANGSGFFVGSGVST